MIGKLARIFLLAGLSLAVTSAVNAGSDCQPLFEAYAAQMKAPALKKTITTPGMKAPVVLILTQDALYGRTGAGDSWSKTVINDATRAVMKRGYPTPDTVTDCHKVGPQEIDGVAATAYELTPSATSGNAPGERLTVLIGDDSGLPLSETALKAGTQATIVYDGVTAPVP